MERAFSLALLNAGSSIDARIAIIAMTTSNSISVNVFIESFLVRVLFAGVVPGAADRPGCGFICLGLLDSLLIFMAAIPFFGANVSIGMYSSVRD